MRSDAAAAAAGERYRVLLEINNAIVSKLTREILLHAISGALHWVSLAYKLGNGPNVAFKLLRRASS